MKTFKEYVAGKNVYVSRTSKMVYTGTIPPDPLILPDAAILQANIDGMAADCDVDAPWTHPQGPLEWASHHGRRVA